jgi:hypothetical protein
MNSRDKIKILFPNSEDVLKMFHINFETGKIYKKDFWDRNIHKELGRPTSDKNYKRININCPNLTHIFKRGYTDVSLHRLIYYAHTGELPEKVDHKEKNIEYPDAIFNLTTSDSVHNRWNTKKVKRRKLPPEQRIDNSPSAYRQRNVEEYRGIYVAYNYYWALFDGEIINENGFIHPILAVNFRNEFLKEEFMRRYGSLDNFPENALDIIDEQELFLEQMTQEAVEKTEDYKLKQEKIKQEKQKRSDMASQRKLKKQQILKNKISIKVEDDPFDCIGKYDS